MIEAQVVIDRTIAVLLRPTQYFSDSDGLLDYNEGASYAAVMGVIGALLTVVLTGALFSNSAGMVLLVALILGPIGAVLGAVIGGAVIFGICRFLGSRKDYGDAFSISTAAAALYPVNALLNLIPVVGALLAIGWSWWIVTEAVVAVHGIDRGSARISFGIVYGLLALVGLFA